MLKKLKRIVGERRSKRRVARLRLQYYRELEASMQKLSRYFQSVDAENPVDTDEDHWGAQ